MRKPDTYKTILVMVTGLLLIGYIFKIQILYPISLGIALLACLSTYLASKIEWIWMKFAHVLGWINSRILLSIVYFVFLTPIALLRRVFQKESNWKLRVEKKSFFVERNHTYTKDDLINPW
jgi:hypothetical protein